MIDTLIIKNFKSLKNVRFDLQKINLFIGPNNSGKTNVFKALEYLFNSVLSDNTPITPEHLRRDYFGFGDKDSSVFKEPISFTFCKKKEKTFEYYIVEFWGLNEKRKVIKREFTGETTKELPDNFSIGNWKKSENLMLNFIVQWFHNPKIFIQSVINFDVDSDYFIAKYNNKKLNQEKVSYSFTSSSLFLNYGGEYSINTDLLKIAQNIRIYSPDPNQIKKPWPLGTDDFVNSDASNLVSFFDNMRDYQPEIFADIRNGLTECLHEIKDIRFKKIKLNGEI